MRDKLKILALIMFMVAVIGCEKTPTKPEKKIISKNGTVYTLSIVRVSSSVHYMFGTYGGNTPGDLGFEEGDKVYFEAEEVARYQSSNGRTTCQCILISMVKR
jgi:hypothetical protein